MAALDRSQPYNQVFNDPEGRYFEQAGVFFTAGGDAWVPAEPAAAPTSRKKAATAAPADTPLDAQVDAQLDQPPQESA